MHRRRGAVRACHNYIYKGINSLLQIRDQCVSADNDRKFYDVSMFLYGLSLDI